MLIEIVCKIYMSQCVWHSEYNASLIWAGSINWWKSQKEVKNESIGLKLEDYFVDLGNPGKLLYRSLSSGFFVGIPHSEWKHTMFR